MPWEIDKVEEPVVRFIPERKCAHCGETFQPLERRTKCCSVSCGVRYSAAVKAGRVRCYVDQIDIADRKCKVCDAVFVPKNGKQLYCCEHCYRVAKSERAKNARR